MTRIDVGYVVDRSEVARQLLARLLALHAKQIETFSSVSAAREASAAVAPDLVVAEIDLPDCLTWLDETLRADVHPSFVFTTAHPSHELETRVSMTGAIGYLAKPFTYRELASTLATSSPFYEAAPPRVESAPLARAVVVDPETDEPQVSCEVRDLTLCGGFLAAAAPIALDTRLRLQIFVDAVPIAVEARVVRVQEPRWGVTAGWGVAFETSDESQCRIRELVGGSRQAEAAP